MSGKGRTNTRVTAFWSDFDRSILGAVRACRFGFRLFCTFFFPSSEHENDKDEEGDSKNAENDDDDDQHK